MLCRINGCGATKMQVGIARPVRASAWAPWRVDRLTARSPPPAMAQLEDSISCPVDWTGTRSDRTPHSACSASPIRASTARPQAATPHTPTDTPDTKHAIRYTHTDAYRRASSGPSRKAAQNSFVSCRAQVTPSGLQPGPQDHRRLLG